MLAEEPNVAHGNKKKRITSSDTMELIQSSVRYVLDCKIFEYFSVCVFSGKIWQICVI